MTTTAGAEEKKTRKVQEERILAESRKLFWDQGYTETSMRDIAGACSFRPANIYNFFENKESILYEILEEEMLDILGPVRYLKDDETVGPEEALYRFIENHVKLTLGEKSSSKLLFDVGLKNLSSPNRRKIIRLRDEYDAIGGAIIRSGIEAGAFVPMDEKIAIYSIASIIARSRIWFSPEGKYTVEEIVDFIYRFSLGGLTGNRLKGGAPWH